MPSCFVIMPISTPENLVAAYQGDSDHFRHVLDHLFAPAINKIDYEVIPPIAEGADLIHAEIIKNLETSDLVLCDMSNHNPNVFFELGIRVALDKPICLVRDGLTLQVPFDTSLLNYHTYDHALSQWTSTQEIDSLANHLQTSMKRAKGKNPLWKYFGLTMRGTAPEGAGNLEEKVDFLVSEISSLKRQSIASGLSNSLRDRHPREDLIIREFLLLAEKILGKELVNKLTHIIPRNDGSIDVGLMSGTTWDLSFQSKFDALAEGLATQLRITHRDIGVYYSTDFRNPRTTP